MRYNEIMNENEYLKVNDRYYVNPQLSVDESEQFLEKLKTAQAEGNARIAQETHNLGTDVPSSMGGLSGSGGVWQQRYQTPQVNSMVADLKATAQAQALNETLSNLMAQKQQEYKNAYRAAYKKKESNQSGTGTNKNTGTGGNITQENSTRKIVDYSTEGLWMNKYLKLFQQYKQEGLSNEEAEAKAKEAMKQ